MHGLGEYIVGRDESQIEDYFWITIFGSLERLGALHNCALVWEDTAE